MSSVRAAMVVSALFGSSVLVFEPHLESGPASRYQIEQYQLRRLSQLGQAGSIVYANHCRACHGRRGVGSVQGPPLLDYALVKKHRGRKAFHSAVTNEQDHSYGAHHSRSAKELSFNEIEQIGRYVREVQSLTDDG